MESSATIAEKLLSQQPRASREVLPERMISAVLGVHEGFHEGIAWHLVRRTINVQTMPLRFLNGKPFAAATLQAAPVMRLHDRAGLLR